MIRLPFFIKCKYWGHLREIYWATDSFGERPDRVIEICRRCDKVLGIRR